MELIKGGLANNDILRTVLDSIGDAVSIQDIDFKVLYQNQAHKDLIGDNAGEYCYKAYEHREHVCEGCPVAGCFKDGGVHSAVRSSITDRGLMYVEITASPLRDARGEIAGGIEVVRNISERKRIEQELFESKQMLDDITQGITESILLLSKDFKILWANKAALEQTGLSMDELIGDYCYKATHRLNSPCEVPNDPCPVYELQKTGNPTIAEHIHYDRNGNRISVEVNAYPIKNEQGEIIRFVHVSKDVSQRKGLEQEREKLIAELQNALAEVKILSGLLPICASCKNIRDDKGYWTQIETYISQHSDAKFTHGVCPECIKTLYPEIYKDMYGKGDD